MPAASTAAHWWIGGDVRSFVPSRMSYGSMTSSGRITPCLKISQSVLAGTVCRDRQPRHDLPRGVK
jgi:hypothetical protein